MMPPDHVKLSLQEMCENAEANGVCQALISMIQDSA